MPRDYDKSEFKFYQELYVDLDRILRGKLPDRTSFQLSKEAVLDCVELDIFRGAIDDVWWWITNHWNYLCCEADGLCYQEEGMHSGQSDVQPVDQGTILHYSLRNREQIQGPQSAYDRFMPEVIKKPSSRKRKLKSSHTVDLTLENALKMVQDHAGYHVLDLSHDDEPDSDEFDLPKALRVIMKQKRYKVVDLTGSDFPMDMSESSDNSSDDNDATEVSILNAIRDNDRDALKIPLEFGVRCDCGMMLLDSDAKRTPEQLNKILRSQNVAMCVLRSKSASDALLQMEDEIRSDQVAKMGDFAKAVTQWGLKGPNGVPLDVDSDDWAKILQSFSTRGGSMTSDVIEPLTDVDLLESATDTSFKTWWQNRTESLNIQGTTWPSQCEASLNAWHLEKEQMLTRCCALLNLDAETDEQKTRLANATLDDCIMHLMFGTSIGGEGTPPHIDSHADIVAMKEDEKTYKVTLSLACGYIIQGVKYFWCLPPKGGHFAKYLDYIRHRKAVGQVAEETKYRSMLRHGGVPPQFTGYNSFGWSSVRDWDNMDNEGLCNHFHPLRAGDFYLISEGAVHAAINDKVDHPVSVTYDDHWMGSHPDLYFLLPCLRSLIKH